MKILKSTLFRMLIVTVSLCFFTEAYAVDAHKVRPRSMRSSNFTTYDQIANPEFYDKLNFSVHWSFLKNPIEYGGVNDAAREDSILEDVHLLNLNMSYNLNKNFMLAVDLSASYLQKFEELNSEFDENEFVYINDIHLSGVWTFYRSENKKTQYAFAPRLIIPTGDEHLFLGENSFSFGADLLAQWRPKSKSESHLFTSRLGYTHRDKTQILNLEVGPSLDLAIGHQWMFNKKKSLSLNSELVAEIPVAYRASGANLPVEFLLGFKDFNQKGRSWSVLLGKGLSSGYGSPDWRVSLGISFSGYPHGQGAIKNQEPKDLEPKPVVKKKKVKKLSTKQRKAKKKLLETSLLEIRNVNFESNKAIITEDSFKILDAAKKTLEDNINYIDGVVISGHTDSQGKVSNNQLLSEQRAAAVKDFLSESKVLSENLKFQASGFGESQPLVEETDAATRKMNRRVELKLEMKND